MSYERDAAGRYRERATQLRSMTTTYEDREIAKAVGGVAKDYDLMAQVFDDIDQAGLAALRARKSS